MKQFKGMDSIERGEELWNRAGAMKVSEAVESYGGVEEAVSAALEVLAEDDEFEYEGDAAIDIRRFVEHAIGY